MDSTEIVRRFNELKTERTNRDSIYYLIEQFVRPFSGDFFREVNSELAIDWNARQLFDSTAITANNQLAAAVHGALTPPLIKWLTLTFEDDDLNDDQEAAEWLENCGDRVYLALEKSDFQLEMNKACDDLTSYAEAYIFEEERGELTGELNFTAAPVKDSYFEEGEDGQPLAYYRELRWTPSKCIDKFGDDCPADIRKKFEEGKVGDKDTIIFAAWKRQDYRPIDTTKPVAPERREWGWAYVYEKDKTVIGKEGGYYERPIFVPRWLESSDSKHGISPAMRAMPDILSLNEVKKIIFTASEKAIDPPLLVEESGLFSDIDIRAGGVTLVRDKDAVVPLQLNYDFAVGEMNQEDLRRSIREAFHDNDLQLKESPQMTATEVMARVELMQRVLGPTFGYLKSLLLDPLIERTFNILYRAGKLPAAPQSVLDAESGFSVEYLGSMARSQKREEVDAIQGFLGDLLPMLEAFPEIRDNIDVDDLVRRMAEARNLPKSAMTAIEDVLAMRKRREEMAAAERQLDNDNIASQTISNAANAQRQLRVVDGGRQ